MPLAIPIEGAGDVGYVTNLYAVFGGAEVGASAKYATFGSHTIEAISTYDSFAGIEITKQTHKSVPRSIKIVNNSLNPVYGSAEVVLGPSFLILADVLQEELSAENLAQWASVEINAILKINDVEVPIKSFNFQKPTGRLGSLLNVTLADPDYDLVPLGASVYFGLVFGVEGVNIEYPLMTNSKLTDTSYEIRYRGGKNNGPIDEVSFGTLDAMGDRFTLSPLRPVIMFDPNRVRFDDIKTDPENAIRELNGRIVYPIIEPVNGLTMKKILNRAYTGVGSWGYTNTITSAQFGSLGLAWESMYAGNNVNQNGCGFERVITNIEDYPVRQANFTVEGGWHDGAQPVVAMYAPIYFLKGEDLVILDVDQPLPYGVTPYNVSLSYHKALSLKQTFQPDKNQLLLTYQYMGNDPYENPTKLFREVQLPDEYPVDTSSSGGPNFGEEGYIKQTLKERVREYYMSDTPDDVLDTQPVKTQLITEQTIVIRDDGGSVSFSGVRVSGIEETEHFYAGDLKIGHSRTVQSRIFTPETLTSRLESQMLTVLDERSDISWIDDPAKPGVKMQSRVVTTTSELCVSPAEPQEIWIDDVAHEHYPLISLLEANLGAYIDSEWRLTSNRVKSMTKTEILRRRKHNQYDVLVTEVDHLNGGGVRNSIASPTIAYVGHDPYAVRSRTIRLKNDESIAEIGPRIPDTLNTYELPRDRAIELGQRRLARLLNPLKNMPIDLPTPDLAIDRGSVIRGQTRDGYTGNFIVTGLSITGQALGKHGEHRIFENLECVELLSE